MKFDPALHTAGMMLFPAIMGLSTCLCLRSRPGAFSIVAVDEYVQTTKSLDRLWLLVTLAWVALAASRSSGPGAGATPIALAVAVAVVAVVLIAAHFWFQAVLADELKSVAGRLAAVGGITTVSAAGVCIAHRREPDSELYLESSDLGVGIYSLAGAVSLAVFVAAIVSALGRPAGPSVAQCVLLAGLYVSLGVFLVDMVADVWPGFTTDDRVKSASRYYVQVFEQWKNLGVLAGFMTVVIGAPYVFYRGEAPAAVMSFPIWIVACLCFATFFNQVLYRRGVVTSRLPLPVWVNVYSLSHPLWAHFFAVIHLFMAAGLVVGLAVLGI